MIRIAVASGKGGTGKTTISVNLARVFYGKVQLLDCDVEEPNAHLFLSGVSTSQETITVLVPKVDGSLCNGCGVCARICQYHAIVNLGAEPLVFPDMCHACGGCTRVCPTKAIIEIPHRIGVIEHVTVDNSMSLLQGILDVGRTMAPPLIRAVRSHMNNGVSTIVDAPPGTSCPVIAAVRDTDFVVLVTEPTPFGLHDLRLAVDMVRTLGRPLGVVVNRMGIGDNRVHDYCDQQQIPLLAEIPDDRRIAKVYSRGAIVVDELPEYRELFETLLLNIRHRIIHHQLLEAGQNGIPCTN